MAKRCKTLDLLFKDKYIFNCAEFYNQICKILHVDLVGNRPDVCVKGYMTLEGVYKILDCYNFRGKEDKELLQQLVGFTMEKLIELYGKIDAELYMNRVKKNVDDMYQYVDDLIEQKRKELQLTKLVP